MQMTLPERKKLALFCLFLVLTRSHYCQVFVLDCALEDFSQESDKSQISPDCFIFEKRISRLHILSFSQIFLQAGAPTVFGCGGAPHCVPVAPSLKMTFK